jgi:hypothetical protein
VRRALDWLTERLRRKGAHISAVYLPQEGGREIGVDDYLLTHTPQDLEGLIEVLRPKPEPAAPVIELLSKSPDVMERPLRMINDQAYAATWLPIRKTIREVKDKNGDLKVLSLPQVTHSKALFVVRDEGMSLENCQIPKLNRSMN